MNILVISEKGRSLGIVERIRRENYAATFYAEDIQSRYVGNGIVDKPEFNKQLLTNTLDCVLSSIVQLLKEASPDLVLVDSTYMGKVAEYIKESGLQCLGSSYWSDVMTNSEDYSNKLMKRVGIKKSDGVEGVKVEVGIIWNGLETISVFLIFNELHGDRDGQ